MKKFLLALYVLLCPLCVIAQDESRSGMQSEKFSAMFIGGLINGFDSNHQMACFGLALGAYNIHLDLSFLPAEKSSSTDVAVWKNKKKCFNFHAGYRIPTKTGFGVTPLVGTSTYKIGDVDGYHWTVNSSGIKNDFIEKESHTRFDYGVQLDYHFDSLSDLRFKAALSLTRYVQSIGFGICFM